MSELHESEQQQAAFPASYFWITAAVVLIDQFTKLLVKGSAALGFSGMPIHTSKPLIGDILRITYVENPGIAFGINIPAMKIVFSLFSIVASVLIFLYLKRSGWKMTVWERVAWVLIMGGAIGNLIDRCFYGVFYGESSLFYGRVVDFLDFGYKENWWPVFNIADSAVTVGVSILVAIMLFKKEAPKHPPVANTAA